MKYTSPDNIPYPESGDDFAPIEQWLRDQADAVQLALTPVAAASSAWANSTNWSSATSQLWRWGRLAFLNFDVSSSVNVGATDQVIAARVPSGFRPAQTVLAGAVASGITSPVGAGIQINGGSSGGQLTVFNNTGTHRRWTGTVIYELSA